MSRNGGTLGGGWVHLKGANSMAASGLGYRKALVGIGWANIVRMEAPQGQKSCPFMLRTEMLLFSQFARAFIGREP